MPDSRPEFLRRLVVTRYEEHTHTALQEATKAEGGHVFPKVRLADIIAVDQLRQALDLTPSDVARSLRLSLDFVVTDDDLKPLFAVEYDGPQHSLRPDVMSRDRLKDQLCSAANLQLLRIEAEYLRGIGRFASMVQWLAELRLLEVKFDQAQAEGQIPPDEAFTTLAFWDDKGPTHDPFMGMWGDYQRMRVAGRVGNCYGGSLGVVRGKERAAAVMAVPPIIGGNRQLCVVGEGACRFSYFGGQTGSEFAGDLAGQDALDKVERFHAGRYKAVVTEGELANLKTAMKSGTRFSMGGPGPPEHQT